MSAGARGPGVDDPGEEEHLFGAGASAGRVGGGADRGRADRGVVCGKTRTSDGTTAWPIEASHRLSSRDRRAGAQAGGVRTLRVPRGSVSDGDVSAGVRCAGGAARGACGPGVSEDLAVGVAGRRVARRGGADEITGAASGVERASGADAHGPGDAAGGGEPCGGVGGGFADVRRPVGGSAMGGW